jgi:hypothetical protein
MLTVAKNYFRFMKESIKCNLKSILEYKKSFAIQTIFMIANFKKYVSMVLVVCMVIALACLVACNNNQPQETTPEATTIETTTKEKTTTPEESTPESTPESTTPEATIPEQTTTTAPTVTVTFPSDEDDDPKQEDVFFD